MLQYLAGLQVMIFGKGVPAWIGYSDTPMKKRHVLSSRSFRYYIYG